MTNTETASTSGGEVTTVSTGQLEMNLLVAMSGLQSDMRHVRETGDKTHDEIKGLSSRVATVESDVAVLKARPAQSPIDPETQQRLTTLEANQSFSKEIVNGIQTSMTSTRLTWPKLIAGLAAVVGTLIALGFVDRIPPIG